MSEPFGTLYVTCPASVLAAVLQQLEALYPQVAIRQHEADEEVMFALDVSYPNVTQFLGLMRLWATFDPDLSWDWRAWNAESPYNYES